MLITACLPTPPLTATHLMTGQVADDTHPHTPLTATSLPFVNTAHQPPLNRPPTTTDQPPTQPPTLLVPHLMPTDDSAESCTSPPSTPLPRGDPEP